MEAIAILLEYAIIIAAFSVVAYYVIKKAVKSALDEWSRDKRQ